MTKNKHARVVFAGLLALAGCSLEAPKRDELFSPSTAGDRDAGSNPERDAAVTDEDAQVEDPLDGSSVADAAADAFAADAAVGADAASDAGSGAFDPSVGLVVHYRFNETTGNTVNDFAGDKDAVIVGTPAGFEQWVSAGHIDGALSLAGGNPPDGGVGHHVQVPQGVLLDSNEATIALWLNRQGGPIWQRVFDFGSSMPVWIYFTAFGDLNSPIVAGRTPAALFVDYRAIPEAPAGEGLLRINQSIPVGTWTHFALTWSANELKVYLNGKLAATTKPYGMVAPTDLGNTSQNFIGRSQFPADPYFNGMLDEFRIYNRVLSESDVAALFALQ